jgi:hypothetical protein
MFQNGTRLSCLVGYGAFTYKNGFSNMTFLNTKVKLEINGKVYTFAHAE